MVDHEIDYIEKRKENRTIFEIIKNITHHPLRFDKSYNGRPN